MNKTSIKKLLRKYRAGTCSADEIIVLESWYLSKARETGDEIDEVSLMLAQQRIEESIKKNTGISLRSNKIVRLWPRIAAAASILIFLCTGFYFLIHKRSVKQTTRTANYDVAPGDNRAILTTNGKRIVLDETKSGLIVNHGNLAITKASDGLVVYRSTSAGNRAGSVMLYDTLTIPRGGQHQLLLADGTKIWLDADTKFRYPEQFTGKERLVELISGEAYFEVVHNSAKPFRVKVKNQVIEDLGTHFNINAYDDESAIRTTLVEGSIRLKLNMPSSVSGKKDVVLEPGQQAIVGSGMSTLTLKAVDTEEALAWKNGYFRFNNEKIQSVMRKLSRWYDIDVQFAGKTSDEGYYGHISRYKNISEVLKMLEQTKGIHFKIEGRRVTVLQ